MTVVSENSEVVGPRSKGRTCAGCPSFETREWDGPSGDGEIWDRGRYALCLSANRSIGGSYVSRQETTPDWCPALSPDHSSESSELLYALSVFEGLTEEERREIFSKFCISCGVQDPTCQCWNDE